MRVFSIFLLLAAATWAEVIPGRFIVELPGEPAALYAVKNGRERQAAEAERRAQILADQSRKMPSEWRRFPV